MRVMNADPADHYTAHEPLPDLGEQTGVLKNSCGICKELYTCRGERNMCALACSHTLCLTCVKGIQDQATATNTPVKCPYCRVDVIKVIVLRYDPPEEEDDDDDEPIVIPPTAGQRAAAAAAQRAADADDDEPLVIRRRAVDID
jgi:hypothetical protein